MSAFETTEKSVPQQGLRHTVDMRHYGDTIYFLFYFSDAFVLLCFVLVLRKKNAQNKAEKWMRKVLETSLCRKVWTLKK